MKYRSLFCACARAALAVVVGVCWVLAPRPAEASLIQFDFTSTGDVMADGFAGYSLGDTAVMRGRVIFDTTGFDAATFYFGPHSSSSEMILTGLRAQGGLAVAQADFWIDDHHFLSGSDGAGGLMGDRQGAAWFDGQWSADLGDFSFTAVEGGATGAVPLSQFGLSGDPLGDFLLSHTQLGNFWGLSTADLGRVLRGRATDRVGDPAYSFSVHKVPEPSTLALFAFGMIGLTFRHRSGSAQRNLVC